MRIVIRVREKRELTGQEQKHTSVFLWMLCCLGQTFIGLVFICLDGMTVFVSAGITQLVA